MYDDTSGEEDDVVGLVMENADIVVVMMVRASGNSMSGFMMVVGIVYVYVRLIYISSIVYLA